jgi:hypothetical protein
VEQHKVPGGWPEAVERLLTSTLTGLLLRVLSSIVL